MGHEVLAHWGYQIARLVEIFISPGLQRHVGSFTNINTSQFVKLELHNQLAQIREICSFGRSYLHKANGFYTSQEWPECPKSSQSRIGFSHIIE